MINPRELRIGNWVFDEFSILSELKIAEVFSLQSINGKDYINGSLSENYHPIPLTPEILEACGVTRNSVGWHLSSDNMLYDPLTLGGAGGYVQRDTKIFAFIHADHILKRGVRYFHELQNLYYALTGTELTYNPK